MILGYELWKWLIFLGLVIIVGFFSTLIAVCMIKSKKNIMESDYKNKKTSFDYYMLYSKLLESIKKDVGVLY